MVSWFEMSDQRYRLWQPAQRKTLILSQAINYGPKLCRSQIPSNHHNLPVLPFIGIPRRTIPFSDWEKSGENMFWFPWILFPCRCKVPFSVSGIPFLSFAAHHSNGYLGALKLIRIDVRHDIPLIIGTTQS
jgi:hypothetical protein